MHSKVLRVAGGRGFGQETKWRASGVRKFTLFSSRLIGDAPRAHTVVVSILGGIHIMRTPGICLALLASAQLVIASTPAFAADEPAAPSAKDAAPSDG